MENSAQEVLTKIHRCVKARQEVLIDCRKPVNDISGHKISKVRREGMADIYEVIKILSDYLLINEGE